MKTEPQMKRAFLSHSSSDANVVEKVAREFITNGIEVWLDKWEIRAGDSIIEKISNGLVSNDILIIFLSKRSVKSPWVARELNIALTGELKSRRTKVIPVLLEDCRIPVFLVDKRYVDFRSVKIDGDEFRGNPDFIVGFEELVQGVMGDNTIPFYTSSVLKAAITEKVIFKLMIDKPEQFAGTVLQTMKMIPTRSMDGWRTTVTYFGSIAEFNTNMAKVVHEDTSRGSRLFKIGFDRTYVRGERFDLSYQYSLLDNFHNPETCFWDFSIGVHTLSSTFEFVFVKPVSSFRVFKRVSDSERLLTAIEPVDSEGVMFKTEYGFLPSDMCLVFRWTYRD